MAGNVEKVEMLYVVSDDAQDNFENSNLLTDSSLNVKTYKLVHKRNQFYK